MLAPITSPASARSCTGLCALRPLRFRQGELNGSQHHSSPHDRRAAAGRARLTPVFETELSAQLRDRLIAEAHELSSSDAAAGWAHKSLADKNKPTEGDAQAVEQAFRARLEALGIGNKDPSVAAAPNPAASAAHEPNVRRSKPKRRRRFHPIDESVLAMLEPRRLGDRDHARSVAQHLGRRPADAHHLRFAPKQGPRPQGQ